MTGDGRPVADLGARLTRIETILGVHIPTPTSTPNYTVDLVVYHRGPVQPDTHQAVAAVLGEHAAPRPARRDGPRRLRAAPDLAPVNWSYQDLDQIHRLMRRTDTGQHRFDLDPSQVHLVPDFQPLADLSRSHVLADTTGELTLLHRRLQHYPALLADALIVRLWEAGLLLGDIERAAHLGDTVGVAAGVARIVELTAHALHGHAHTWPPDPTALLATTCRLTAAPTGFKTTADDLLAHLGTRPSQLCAATDGTARLLRTVTAACQTRQG